MLFKGLAFRTCWHCTTWLSSILQRQFKGGTRTCREDDEISECSWRNYCAAANWCKWWSLPFLHKNYTIWLFCSAKQLFTVLCFFFAVCLHEMSKCFGFVVSCKVLLTLILQKPEKDSWGSGLEAMQAALELEKTVNQSILDLHSLASSHNDPHVSCMIMMHTSYIVSLIL